MSRHFLIPVSLFLTYALAQVPGPLTPEVHPALTSYKCTKAGGCIAANTSVVLDANYRWLHNVDGYTNCVTTGFNKDFCPDVETCAKTCSLEGVDYASYGIYTSGDALTLNIYKTDPVTNVTSLSSPRVYLMEDDDTYDHFKLLNKEFSFDVDVSKVPCGINGALYFSEMNDKGDANELNQAGAKYGTGYCDAQCPSQNFIKGVANLNQTFGSCCNEMDIWEANSAATAYTPHPCTTNQVFACQGVECGNGDGQHYLGVCDKDGCDINPYRNGNKAYYGYGSNHTVDTSQKLTVVTQFLTTDNTANGTLQEIRRLYLQNGRVIQNSAVTIPGLTGNSITDSYCTAQKSVLGGVDDFTKQGGLKQMGEAIGRGMVLALSIWDDAGSYMGWLDQDPYPADADPSLPGVGRGPCPTTGGRPADLIRDFPDARVVFSAIKSGEIGSTFVETKRSPRRTKYE